MKHSTAHGMVSHTWLMLVACGGALVLLFVLPLTGLSQSWSLGIAMAVMVGLHLLMMRRHSNHRSSRKVA